MCKITNKKIVTEDTFVRSLHHQLLNQNDKNINDALNDAVVWIAELQLQVDALKSKVSSGFIRTDTSSLRWKSKDNVPAVDAGDDWIKTGATDG